MGYIFQNYNLNKGVSCFDNVADALRLCGVTDKSEIRRRVMAALTNVGMENYHGRLPDTLSGGQQQRIAIARAIVKNPKIILADEPTGNLDEANTVMIMDLLKEISREHLVILVTHEAHLVDHYCDTVIELSDGKVVAVKNNDSAEGMTTRKKNDIYLGELERAELTSEAANIDFYGNAPETPIKLRIVNDGGKIYISVDSPNVMVLDSTSEVKLREGVYEEETQKQENVSKIDMSALPTFEGKRFGRLFSFGSAVKSGYGENFKMGKKKNGKKVLRNCLCLFAAVVVVMSAIFGTAFSDIIDAKNAYNHNVFYVYTPNSDVSATINEAVGDDAAGVDFVRLMRGIASGDSKIQFMSGFFESFSTTEYDESFTTNAVYLSMKLTEDKTLLAGKKTELSERDVVISSKVADALIKKSSLGYINDYDSLIGLVSSNLTIDDKSVRIAGVVEGNESAVYFNELALAKYVNSSCSEVPLMLGSEYEIDVKEGETVLTLAYAQDDADIPKVGDTVKVNGKDLKIAQIVKSTSDYFTWLKHRGIAKITDPYEYFERKVASENTDKTPDELSVLAYETMEKNYYEYILYLYEEYEEFILEKHLLMGTEDISVWIYFEKGVEDAKYMLGAHDLYIIEKYKELNGKYPSQSEYQDFVQENSEMLMNNLNEIIESYQDEYASISHTSLQSAYFLNEADYLDMSRYYGETDFLPSGNGEKDIYYAISQNGEEYGHSFDNVQPHEYVYTVIHSSDPAKTERWLEEHFSTLDTGHERVPAVLTPDEIFDNIMSASKQKITTGLITMLVIFVVMSLCMYFIMRSSLMNRIKEVGIYRAIGVSKKNLMFKFLIETLVLTTLTVFVGYLVTSSFIGVCIGISGFVKSILYYPAWLAFAILGILYAICVLFGLLPVLSLLRKTPSQILSKYDI